MNKRKILFGILTLVLLITVMLGIAIPTLASSLVVDDPSWISTPRETPLTKCPGGTQCDHSDGVCDYDYVYSFAVVGDTQNINIIDTADTQNAYMNDLYNWIIDKKDDYNIQYVLGLGDITQAYHSSYSDKYGLGKDTITLEWANAKAAISLLDGELGYSLVRGNHDVSSYFNDSFGTGTAYYNALKALAEKKDTTDASKSDRYMAGFFNEDKIEDTYRKVIIGDHKYIIFTLDWFPTSRETDCTDECAEDCAIHDCLGWVDRTLAANSDYTAIITTHDFIYRDATIVDDYEDTFPYENLLGTRPYWEEVSASGGNATPRALWEVLRKHENVELILCGHVDEDDIKVTQLRGDNGNTVTAMLIDGQTIDSTVEPVGMVAIFYMSHDGKVMNVDYVSTVRDNDERLAYLGTQNQFEIDLDLRNNADADTDTDGTVDGWVQTTHGDIPSSVYSAYPFHILLDDDSDESTNAHFYGSYACWEDALVAIREFNAKYTNESQKKQKTFYIVMSKDYADSFSGIHQNQASLNTTKVVLDLNDKTLTLGSAQYFLPFYTNHSTIFPRYAITNGNIIIDGNASLAVLQSGNSSQGTLELTDLNITYNQASSRPLITYFGGSGTADVTLKVTNCNIDSSKVTDSVTTLFDLKDTNDNNHVDLTLCGGSITGSTAANTVIITQHIPGDKVRLAKYSDGSYTKLTLADSATLSHVFYTDMKENGYTVFYEFGTPTLNSSGTAYDYLLEVSEVTLTDYGAIPAKYNSVDDYPFVVFKDGECKHAFSDWYTFFNDTVKTDYQSGCTLLLRRNYTTGTDSTSNPSQFGYIDDMIIDLGGNTLTRGTKHLFQLVGRGQISQSDGFTDITVTNGTVVASGSYPVVFNNSGNNSTDAFNITFKDVTFNVTGTNGIVVCYKDGSYGSEDTVVLEDCTVNRGTSTSNVTLFSLTESSGNKIDVDVVIKGGTLVANSLTGLTLATYSVERETGAGSPDKVYLEKGSDGNYLKVKSTSALSDATTATYALTDGNHMLSLTGQDSSYYYYSFVNLTTEYGDIKPANVSVDKFPFVVFKDGEMVDAFSDWYEFFNTTVMTDYQSGCTLLLRRNYTTGTDSTDNPNQFGYIDDMVIDLGGNTLTRGTKHLFQLVGRGQISQSDGFTDITVTNGTVVASGSYPVVFNNNGNNSTDAFNITFKDVTFNVTGTNGIVVCYKDGSYGSEDTVVLEDCTVNRGASTSNVTLFSLTESSGNKIDVDVVIKGGTLVSDSLAGLTLATYSAEREAGAGSPDSLVIGRGSDGNYLKLQSTSSTAPTFSLTADDGRTLTFFLDASSGSIYLWGLGVTETISGVGSVSPEYSNWGDYPLILKNSDGSIIGCTTWNEALTYVANDTDGEFTICLRRDMEKVTKKHIANFCGSLTVDLGGHVLTVGEAGNYLLDLGAKNADGLSAQFTLKNGTVVKTGGRGVVLANYSSELKDKDNNYTFDFDGVTFRSEDNTYTNGVIFTTWEDGYDGATACLKVNSTFTDCTFDLANSIDGAIMLNLTHSSGTKDRAVHTVTVAGGSILLGGSDDFADDFARCDAVTDGRYDTVTFAKNESGRYAEAVLPSGTTLTATVNEGKFTYVQKSDDGTDATYELIPTAALNISFVPRTSITLDSNLHLNVYVPTCEYLTSFTLDGNVYDPDSLTATDGYYLFSIELPAKEAAREITLTADFAVEGEALSASFTFSTLRYAEKLLADTGASATEKTLICDALNYIRSAYVYFGGENADEVVAAIDDVTDGFTFTEFNTVGGTTDLTVPTGVTLILGATPRIRFYFEDGTELTGYTFKIDNAAVPFIADQETVDSVRYECADISLFAYRMIDTIDLYEGESKLGSFQINSYYEFAKGQESAALVDVVEKFYTYCRSALAYRNSVLQDSGN